MADFRHVETPAYGTCAVCGTGYHPDGFVDFVGETNIRRENMDIVGNTDIVICAGCLTQAARLIGCIPSDQATNLLESNQDWEQRYDKVADEVAAWQQRYENIVEIMSMIDPRKYADSDTDIEPIPRPSPSGDLRVQEGTSLFDESARKKQSSRKK